MAGTIRSTDQGLSITSSYHRRQTNTQLNQAQMSASSGGVRGATYASLPENAQSSQMTKIANSELESQNQLFNLFLNDMQLVEQAYDRFESLVIDFNSRIKNYASTFPGDPSFQQFCHDSLKEIETLLNTQSSQKYYLFAGANEDQPPVKSLANLAMPGLGMALDPENYSHFMVSPSLKTVNALGLDVQIDAKYDSEEIVKMIHAFTIGAYTQPPANVASPEYQHLQEAVGLSLDALNGISNKLGHLGTQAQTVKNHTDNNKDQITNNLVIIKECDTVDVLDVLTRYYNLSVDLQIQNNIAAEYRELIKNAVHVLTN